MAKNTDVESVTTLFEAIIREREALSSGKPPGKFNWFKYIDGPPGKGIFHTGDDGWEALWNLTDSAMDTGRITNRADRQQVMRIISNVLMRKFGEEKLEVTPRNVARSLSEAFKAAKRTLKTETHFIPCQLSTDAEKVGVSLGAVRFISRAEAKVLLRKALKVEGKEGSEFEKRDRSHALQAIRQYQGYRWFAQVTVADCADKRSEAIALSAATSALDLLQIIIGARATNRMSIFGQSSNYHRTATISRNESTGGLSVSTGWSTLGQNNLPEGWTDQILEDDGPFGLAQAGIVLESRLNPDLERPLSLRLLDAAQWFGEAVRDTSPSTKVIKYVTALERLTLTRKVEDISESVSDRVAALTTGLIKDLSFKQNKAAFKKVYGLRSDLAHGSISPNHPKVAAMVGKACDYSEAALQRALYNWPKNCLTGSGFKVDDLEGWFDHIVAWISSGKEEEAKRVEGKV